MPALPDCPYCSAASTLEVEWTEMDVDFCLCSCCARRSRVVEGIAYRSGEKRAQRLGSDVGGIPQLDP